MANHRKYYNKVFTCEQCGNSFERLNNREYRFCSPRCRAFAQGKHLVKHTCEWCGEEFERFPSRQGRFCSNWCRCKYGAKQPRPNNRKPETMKIDRICEICGNHFITNIYQIKYRRGGGKYCSIICKSEAASRRLLNGGPNYKGGVKKNGKYFRGHNWERQRHQVLIRDNGKCQFCGMDKRVDVHHIKPYKFFNGDFESANQLPNLITLCRLHHNQIEYGALPCPVPTG